VRLLPRKKLVNIGIGNNRWIKFSRDANGAWRGRGHGYRFQVARAATQWHCRVWRLDGGGPAIASCTFHKMKSAIQEGARLADTTPSEPSCPT